MVPMASSKTAGSTHPPLTDPTTCPSSETAIEVPGPRGPERSTLTTVAMATFLSSSRHSATLSTTGFISRLLFSRQPSAFSRQLLLGWRYCPAIKWTLVPRPMRILVEHVAVFRFFLTADRFILSFPSGGVGDGDGELFEGLEVVTGEEDVHVGERGGHPSREGLVAGGALQGVHPDDPVGEPLQAPHLLG